MNKVELAKGIYFVGALDWNVRDFHGYTTPRGVTYNSYLIVDEKICLIDLVKAPFAEELLERVSAIVDPEKIDYVVINHVEPDHAGALPKFAKHAKNATYIISEKGKIEAERLYGSDLNYQVVKTNDTISLGKNSLVFVGTPMLHWPDSMITYLPEQEILFSNDAFGQHIVTSSRFDDEVDMPDVMYEAEKYFANILFPYAKLIPGALKVAGSLKIKMIMPSHGIIWRSHIADIVGKYADWGKQIKKPKIVMFYDYMWGATETMAKAILEGIMKAGVDVTFHRVTASDNSHITAEILEAGGVLVGSPTLNYTMKPSIAAMLTYLKGLKPSGKLAAGFGTYGWSGGAQKDMEELLTKAGFNLQAGITVQWKGTPEEIAQCRDFGYEFAQKVLADCK